MGSDLCRLRPHGHDWPPPSPRRNGIVAGPGHGRSLRARSPAHDPVAGRNRLRHRRSIPARPSVVCVGKGHPQRRTEIWPVQVAASGAPRPLGDRGAGAAQGWPRTGRSGVGDGPQQRRTESWPVQVGACPSGGKWDEGAPAGTCGAKGPFRGPQVNERDLAADGCVVPSQVRARAVLVRAALGEMAAPKRDA